MKYIRERVFPEERTPCPHALPSLACLIGLVAVGVQAQTPQRPAIGGIGSPPDAMIFYVARGAAGACGRVARIGSPPKVIAQWDTHKRLINILDRQAGRKLPVVIHSWGESNLNVATSLGRILRARGIGYDDGADRGRSLQRKKTEAECFALKGWVGRSTPKGDDCRTTPATSPAC